LSTKTVVLVVRDEEFYIDMCLQSILPFIDHLYILDTGSKDRTTEIINEFSIKYPNKIILECGDFGGSRRFGEGYRELEARNYALSRARAHFNPDWIICMDADEVYSEIFFSFMNTAISENRIGVTHATNIPVYPNMVNNNKDALSNVRGNILFDVHTRIWNDKRLTVNWTQQIGQHVTLPIPVDFIIPSVVHYHLHHMFGPKSIFSWLLWRGDPPVVPPEVDIYKQDFYTDRYPELFDSVSKFIPPPHLLLNIKNDSVVVPDSNKLPNYVVDRWLQWGNF